MTGPQLVVMAAGMGSRYGGLKQIDPIGPNGEIIIDYSIYDAMQAGFEKVIFIIRRDIEKDFRDMVGRHIEPIIDTQYVFQQLDMLPAGMNVPENRVKPWGTGHAVLCAKDAVTAPFAVINADDFYGRGSFAAIGNYLKNARDARYYDYSMVGYTLKNTVSEFGHVARGCCQVKDDKLASIVERTRIQKFTDGIKYSDDDGTTWINISPETIVSMNMWGFTLSFMDELGPRFERFVRDNAANPKAEFFIPLAVNQLMEEDKAAVTVLPCNEKWYGVTYREDKPVVERAIRNMIAQKTYPKNLWA
ncbi:MAG TPA: sugar phosphate nucleotidyltransferase [Phycisphaerae bacterium]|nr:sugar phosphate nucleotidyltransferase [Phycisphaerae bacterium]HPS53839.1 sugar phosphate nucleotidyltransferase [Phycisphaerae bacterium]